MKFHLVLTTIIILALCSCRPNEVEEPVQTHDFRFNETIEVDGITRQYHILHPEESAGKQLVILLHGHSGSYDQILGFGVGTSVQSYWLGHAEEHDFILVVPNGELGIEGTRGWNDCRTDASTNPTTDDVTFISNLIDEIELNYGIDKDRVYVAGISNGGSMGFRLTQEIPEKIAAYTSIVSTIPVNSQCPESTEAIPVLYMNGTMDPIAPYDGGQISGNRGLVQSTDETIDYWIERNQTETNPTIEVFPDLDENDNSTVEKLTYDNGANNSQVVLYRIIGGGHTEPSTVISYGQLYLNIVGGQNKDIEMVDEVWEFFQDKTK